MDKEVGEGNINDKPLNNKHKKIGIEGSRLVGSR